MLANASTLFISAGIAGLLVLLPLIGQTNSAGDGFALSAAAAGALLVPHSLAVMVAAPIAGRTGARIRPRWQIAIGGAVSAVGFAVLALQPTAAFSSAMGAIIGLGCGFAFAAVPILFSVTDPEGTRGSANSVTSINRTVGAGIGTQLAINALVIMVASAGAAGVGVASRLPFLLLGLLCIVGALAGVLMPRACARIEHRVQVAPLSTEL